MRNHRFVDFSGYRAAARGDRFCSRTRTRRNESD